MRPRLLAPFVWGWALCIGVGPLPLGAQLGPEEIGGIAFEGNENFSGAVLAKGIVTRETECRSVVLSLFCFLDVSWAQDPYHLSTRTLRRDVNRLKIFYYQRGFREATIESEVVRVEGEGTTILFRIVEGPPVLVDSIEVVGLEELSDPSILERLPLEAGRPLSSIALEATRDTVLRRLRNRGFAHADVLLSHFIPKDSPYRAEVSFDVFTGPRAFIGPMTVLGNKTVDDAVIRRMIPFREGALYRESEIFDAQRNLYSLQILRHAEIQPDLAHLPDSVVPLLISAVEGDVHLVRTGAGWNNAECFNAEVRWASRNFLGGARQLELRGRVSNILAQTFHRNLCNESGSGDFGRTNWLVEASFTQPWIFSPRNTLTSSVYGERRSVEDIFVQRSYGVNLNLTRSLGRATPISISLRPKLSTLDAAEIFFCSSLLVCDPGDIDVLQSANWLVPVTLSLSRDRGNQLLSPTRGYRALFELEHASALTGSDFAYNRVTGEVSWYGEPRPRTVFAARLRSGWADPRPFEELLGPGAGLEVVHPEKRFFSGGSGSVRGFAQNQLGPRILSVPAAALLNGSQGDDGPACTPREIIALTCDANVLPDGRFTARPTGGNALIEGNIEFRFPIGRGNFEGATFLDFGQVWSGSNLFAWKSIEFAPGLGIRYYTPIGPIRIDLGYRFRGGEDLGVVTSQLRPFDPSRDDPNDRVDGPFGKLDFVRSDELALLRRRVRFGESGPWSIDRFQLHFSIGQAF